MERPVDAARGLFLPLFMVGSLTWSEMRPKIETPAGLAGVSFLLLFQVWQVGIINLQFLEDRYLLYSGDHNL
jgi:hypothetical protein